MLTLDWQPLWLSLQLAAVTTLLLFALGLPLARWLAHTPSRMKPVLEALISLPLVLPPSVLGFYLLLALSPHSVLGQFLRDHFAVQLLFSFPGLVLGSLLYSLPFMVHPLLTGFQALPVAMTEASYLLGKSTLTTLWRIQLPNMKPALLSGVVLTFAHTLGEFGVVLMIGGNIPGVTRVASIAIYDEVESLNYAAAHLYAGVLLLLSFTILLCMYRWRSSVNQVIS